MKVEEFTSGECCICGNTFDGDPYRLTAKDGKAFEVCDNCFGPVKDILRAEGVELEGYVEPPPYVPAAPRPKYWHTKDC